MKPQPTSPFLTLFVIAGALIWGGCGHESGTDGDASRGHGHSHAHDGGHGHSHTHGHEHGDLPYEWSATYEVEAATYRLVFEESEHDPAILVAFFRERDNFDDVAHYAYHAMERGGQAITEGSRFTVQEGAAYNLILNPEGSSYSVEFTEAGRYVLFTEHFAWEFNMKLLDADGNEIEAENPTDHAL